MTVVRHCGSTLKAWVSWWLDLGVHHAHSHKAPANAPLSLCLTDVWKSEDWDCAAKLAKVTWRHNQGGKVPSKGVIHWPANNRLAIAENRPESRHIVSDGTSSFLRDT
jgi:hypothetical protein